MMPSEHEVSDLVSTRNEQYWNRLGSNVIP